MTLRANLWTEVKSCKVGVDTDEESRREENLVEIRIEDNQEGTEGSLLQSEEVQPLLPLKHIKDGSPNIEERLESIPLLVQGVWSEDPSAQLEATAHFRELLSIEPYPTVDMVIKPCVISRFVDFLGRHDLPQLQFEAARVLTNVASGTSEHTSVLIEHGAVPKFVQLLVSASDDTREQAVRALGCIAGHSPSCRDLILSHGALVPLMSLLSDKSQLSMLRIATWTLSNLCRRLPCAPFEQVKPALPVLRQLINLNNEQVLKDALWALSYLSFGSNEKIQAVIDSGVCECLIKLLLHPNHTVHFPALLTVGNIVTGDDTQTQILIDNGVLSSLHTLANQTYKRSIKKKVCWAISNITAGNRAQIQAVIDAQIVVRLMFFMNLSHIEVQKEAAWAICNIIFRGSPDQLRFLVTKHCISALCHDLDCDDPTMVTLCLLGLENILKLGEAEKETEQNEGVNMYAREMYECEGFARIFALPTRYNNEIKEMALKIIDKYWDENVPETYWVDGLFE